MPVRSTAHHLEEGAVPTPQHITWARLIAWRESGLICRSKTFLELGGDPQHLGETKWKGIELLKLISLSSFLPASVRSDGRPRSNPRHP